jgi:hypothetical protein
MDIVLSGIITAILPLQQGVSQRTGQPWASQSYLLCYEQGQYPKSVCFTVFGGDQIQKFAIQQNEQLTVHLNIEARQGQRGYFNDIRAWNVERQQMVQQPMQGAYQQQPVQNPFPQQPVQNPYPPQPAPAPFPQQPAPQPAPFPQQPAPAPAAPAPAQGAAPTQSPLPFPPAQ